MEQVRKPRRLRFQLRQFSLTGMLIVIALFAVYFGYIVNRTDSQAESLVLFERAVAIQPIELFDSRFVDRLLANPDVLLIPTIKRESDPENWLQSHVTISPTSDNASVIRLRVGGNGYRDKTDDFVPLIEAMINTLLETAGPNDRIAVLTAPQLAHR